MRRMFLMVLAALALVAGLIGIAPPRVEAQTQAFDHLKCYQLKLKKGDVIVLPHALDLAFRPLQVPPFSIEDGCRLSPPRPVEVCIPVNKLQGYPPTGVALQHDYLRYRLKCPKQEDFPQGFQDQFVKASGLVHRKTAVRFLLVPAYKIDTPPPPCEPTAPHQCGGTCPNSADECRPGSTDICGCFKPCGRDADGVCGGDCQNAGEKCEVPLGTNDCRCVL